MKGATVIYIDESGTLPDPKDVVVVVAAVATSSPEKIDLILKKAKKKAVLKKTAGELKFYTAGDKTKKLFFEHLLKEDFSIYILAVDKMGRKIPDTPENYAALCCLLLNDVFYFSSGIKTLIFDRHFSRQTDLDGFNYTIGKIVNKQTAILHVQSIKEKRVNIADMIAGATLANETGKDNRFYKMFEKKIVSIKRVNWVEVKKRFITQKNLLEPV